MLVAVSTCWQSTFAQSGRDLIWGLRKMGFSEIELENQVTQEMFVELKPSVTSGGMSAVALHNYFPKPDIAPYADGDLWCFSSTDKDEREAAVRYTKKAIETAAEISAKVLILHCGRIEMDSRVEELKELFNTGEIEKKAGLRVIHDLRKERREKIGSALSRVRSCLELIAGTAKKFNIVIGLENRCLANEIPHSEDLETLLPSLESESFGFWYDAGHAVVQENLGTDDQASFLGRFRDRIVGVHLHDVAGYTDHLPPGSGDVDFAFVKENLPVGAIEVLKVNPGVTKEQMSGSLDYLASAGIL